MRFRPLMGLLLALSCSSPRNPPEPKEWVTDTRNLLDRTTRLSLAAKLDGYYARSGHVVLVWIGDMEGRDEGETVDAYCLRLFNAWGVGRMGKDDGVVLFVFPDEDMRWITVGWGLTRALTDREATHIARNVVGKLVREGDADAGVRMGVDLILAELDAAAQGEIDHQVKQ